MVWIHILTAEPNYSSISIQNSSNFWTLAFDVVFTDSRLQHYFRYSQAKTKQPPELFQNINCQLITICFLHFYHSCPAPWLLRHRYQKRKDIQLILSMMHKQENQHFHLSSFPDRIMCSSYFNHQLEDKTPQFWVFSHSQHVLDFRTNFFHAHTGWSYSAHSNCKDFCSPSPNRSKVNTQNKIEISNIMMLREHLSRSDGSLKPDLLSGSQIHILAEFSHHGNT